MYSVQADQVSRFIGDLLSHLNEKESQVVVGFYFGLAGKDCGENYAEVARQVGCTWEYVRILFNSARQKLKANVDDARLMDALWQAGWLGVDLPGKGVCFVQDNGACQCAKLGFLLGLVYQLSAAIKV